MKIGKFEVKIVNAGYLAMDCGAVFGVIPKALWQRYVEVDENNRLRMSTNCLLLISADQKILIDTGVGNGLGDKLRKIYNIDDDTNLESSLLNKGISPEDVTDVIATHLHFDHAGGLMNHQTKSPFFPNAKYYAGDVQFNWAQNPSKIDRASYKARNYNPLYEAGLLQLLKENDQPISGLKIHYTKGHTPGLLAIEIEDANSPAYYCTDIFPTHYHIPVHYISAYDLYPLDLIREKEFFLEKTWQSNGIILFPHDEKKVAVSVDKINNDYQINKSYEAI